MSETYGSLKECRACDNMLPLDAFRPSRRNPARADRCAKCERENEKAVKRGEPPIKLTRRVDNCRKCQANITHMDVRAEYCSADCRESSRPYRTRREYIMRNKYGIGWAEYDAMMEDQGGACAICETDLSEPKLDHCHATGIVRGILCHFCNVMLGMARDNPEYLASAIRYLGRVPA